jgi:hypothetical protein
MEQTDAMEGLPKSGIAIVSAHESSWAMSSKVEVWTASRISGGSTKHVSTCRETYSKLVTPSTVIVNVPP